MEKKPITQPLTNANPSDTDTSAVFAQEQEHLSATYGKLQEMEKNLEDRIGAIEEKAAAEKLDIRENLALNFEGDSESMETYIEVEVMNHTIDQYNKAGPGETPPEGTQFCQSPATVRAG